MSEQATSEAEVGPRFPDIHVKLTGKDGNAFMILGLVGGALKDSGVSLALCNLFQEEATSGDYDHLLQTCMKWVTVR